VLSLSPSFSSKALRGRILGSEREERGGALGVPKRIGRDDGDDFRDVLVESNVVVFVEELKLNLWTMPYAIVS